MKRIKITNKVYIVTTKEEVKELSINSLHTGPSK